MFIIQDLGTKKITYRGNTRTVIEYFDILDTKDGVVERISWHDFIINILSLYDQFQPIDEDEDGIYADRTSWNEWIELVKETYVPAIEAYLAKNRLEGMKVPDFREVTKHPYIRLKLNSYFSGSTKFGHKFWFKEGL